MPEHAITSAADHEKSLLKPIARDREFPTSTGQAGIWYIRQTQGLDYAYNEQMILRISGELDIARLEYCFNQLIKRHESLRTTFELNDDGEVIQKINEPYTINIAPIPVGEPHIASEAIEREIARIALEHGQAPYNLAADPLLRVCLLQLPAKQQAVVISFHHLAMDGVSCYNLLNDWKELDAAIREGREPKLPELAIQAADYAVWEKDYLHSPEAAPAINYWREKLQNFPPVLDLPYDRPRSTDIPALGAWEPIYLEKELVARLAAEGRKQGVSINIVLLAAFEVLLMRYTRQTDIVVGSPRANRIAKELAPITGHFTNVALLRNNLSGDKTFAQLLREVKTSSKESSYKYNLPYGKLADIARDIENAANFPTHPQVGLEYRPFSKPGELSGCTITDIVFNSMGDAKFDIMPSFTQTDNGLTGHIEYNRSLLDRSTILRFFDHFKNLLHAIALDPHANIASLEIFSERERKKLLLDWNNTYADYPRDKCIHQIFEEQAEQAPDSIAVTLDNQQLTYRELNAKSNQLAHYLIAQGVGPEVKVGICTTRSIEMIVGILGILKAGGVYVPLDPEYPEARIRYFLKDSNIRTLLTENKTSLDFVDNESLNRIFLDGEEYLSSKDSNTNPKLEISPLNSAYVIYTSGSTGTPKGVAVPHRAVNRLVMNCNYLALGPGINLLHASSISFDAATFEIWGALLNGGRCILYPQAIPSVEGIATITAQHKIDGLFLTTGLFNVIVDECPQIFANVSYVLTGGEAASKEHIRRAQAQCQNVNFINVYGPTENTTFSTCYEVPKSGVEVLANIPIGKPISNTTAYIFDTSLNPVPAGVVGELYVGGDGLATGYLGRPALTEERFISHPLEEYAGQRLYKTGDLARYLPDGNIDYVGRIDNQVKLRGFRIELGEIESALTELEHVNDAVVLVHTDRKDANKAGNRYLVAYVVGNADTVPDQEYLRQRLQAQLPAYMIPNCFVSLPKLPLTSNGKVDRKALPLPEEKLLSSRTYVAPHTDMEQALAHIWAGVLNVSVANVGIHDNFFDLGGHSLLATRVVSQIRKTFNVELQVRDIFTANTIHRLALKTEELVAHSPLSDDQAFPLTALPQRNALPLSFAQQRLWFLNQFEDGHETLYNIPWALRLDGPLDIPALQQSFATLVQRHESLRTVFKTVDEQVCQVITESQDATLPVIGSNEAELSALMADNANHMFDLTEGTLFIAKLVRLSPQAHVLLVNMHHSISDGWSIGVFRRELATLYGAFCQGQTSPLPPLPIQYADFAHWQRQWLQGDVLQPQIDYWKTQLDGAPALLELPTDKRRPANISHRGRSLNFTLPTELTQQLQQLSREANATLFMTLLAGFNVLLARYSGQDDICIGTPIANRQRPELEGLIGFFVNTLVLRTHIDLKGSVNELLQQVRETALSAYANQDVPFEHLVEILNPARSLSYSPLFQVMFVLQNNEDGQATMPDIETSILDSEILTAKFDITLSMRETGQNLQGIIEYNTDIFEQATIERLLEHYRIVLQGLANNPQGALYQIPLVSEAERRQILCDWNNTVVDYPQDLCIHQLFEEQAKKNPDAIAVFFEGQQLTYRELNQKSNQLAHYLIEQGLGPEGKVGLFVERSLEMMIGILGTLKAGGAYVPLDPNYPPQRLEFMLDNSDIRIIATQSNLLQQRSFDDKIVALLDLNKFASKAGDACLYSQYSSVNIDCRQLALTSNSLAYVIYTSGSTGQPKGVMIEHSGAVNLSLFQKSTFKVSESSRVLQFASLSFDASVWEWMKALLSGATLYICSDSTKQSPELLKDYLISNAITHAILPPALLQHMELSDGYAFENLTVGGEACDENLAKRWSAKYAMFNGYGPTESTICASVAHLRPESVMNIGQPVWNTQLYVLDSARQLLPAGAIGELYIGGVGLSRGYLNRPDLTKERFVQNPFSRNPKDRLYKTGDLVRYLTDKEGRVDSLAFIGRVDHQIKVRGFRIELGEIENALKDQDNIDEAIVLAHKRAGSAVNYLVAYVVCAENNAIDKNALKDALKKQLPDYMVPNVFIFLPQFPLTNNGKIDRKALPQPEENLVSAQTYVAPRTDLERALVDIWAETLQVAVETVGIHDNFFDLGGHSLLATRVASQARKAFNVELQVRDIFTADTIESLAAEVKALIAHKPLGDREALPLVPLSQRDALPLSFAQQRLWFLDQFEDGQETLYNMPWALRLDGALDVPALQQALTTLVHRHESLRTVFHTVNERAIQIIAKPEAFTLPLVDIDNAELPARLADNVNHVFALAEGPLFIAKLLRLSSAAHVLLLNMHHSISDGWSIGVLNRELATLYTAYHQGQASPLPPLPIQYADFAHWQRQWLQGEVLQTQIDYWKTQLRGAPALLELPTDRPRPATLRHRGQSVRFTLPAELGGQLQQLSRESNATLFMTLLAGFNLLLARYSGQEDICVGTPIANRQRPELEGLIGFFVNTLVLRNHIGPQDSVKELLRQVRETALAAYAHQDVPFEHLVEALNPERSLSYAPLFQVMFALQNNEEGQLAMPGIQTSRLHSEILTAKFDISMNLKETGQGLEGIVEYNTDIFAQATMERLVQHYRNVLQSMVNDPRQILHEIPLISEAERQQILVDWNNTAADYPNDICIHQLFEAQVAKTPDAVAVVFDDQQLTYRELNQKSNQLAHYLIEHGVAPEVKVGLCLERSIEMIVGIVGIAKAGGAYVPLDPEYPMQRLHYLIDDSGVALILTTTALSNSVLNEISTRRFCLDQAPALLEHYSDENLGISIAQDSLIYIIYTSGSTGMPKGVLVTHAAYTNHMQWLQHRFPITAEDKVLHKTPLSFDAAGWEWSLPLMQGATLVVATAGGHRDPDYLLDLIEQQQISVFQGVPSLVKLLVEHEQSHKLRSLKYLFCGGEALSAKLCARFKALDLPATLGNLYGPTEATIDTTYWTFDRDKPLHNVPIGRPIDNAHVYILDAHRHPVPVGVVGELYIGGAGLARGYLNRDDLSAEKFVKNPLAEDSNAVLYRSGDLARYLPDGNIEYVGRVDHQVKIRGFRIELSEIEAALLTCVGVTESVVQAREDRSGGKQLVGYVVAETNVEDAAFSENLRHELAQRLPDYMVPSVIMALEKLPLTPNGKVDRKALPAPDLRLQQSEYVAPRTEAEHTLAAIWQEILGLERAGLYDNFFQLGGHSLLVMKLIAQLQARGYNTDVRAVFKTPRLVELAAALDRKSESYQAPPNRIPEGCDTLTPAMLPLVELSEAQLQHLSDQVAGGAANIQDIYPLAPLQEGILFHHQLHPDNDPYLLTLLFKADNRARIESFANALEQVVQRHDALRTAIFWEGLPHAVQVVLRAAKVPLEEIVLDRARDLEAQLKEKAAPCGQRLNLQQAPLLKLTLAEDTQRESCYLILQMHHLVSDHVGLEIITEEVEAILGGRGEQLSPARPYREFVAHVQHLQATRDSESYFRAQLGDVEEPTAPYGLLNVRGDGTDVVLSKRPVSDDVNIRLRRIAKHYSVSPAVVFHLAFGLVVGRSSGRDDVVIGTVLSGRLQGTQDSSRMMGMFINTLPLRLQLAESSVETCLRRIQADLQELLHHEQTPLSLAQRCSGLSGGTPLFSAMLNYRHNAAGEEQAPLVLGMEVMSGEERTNYPFSVSVNDNENSFSLEILLHHTVDGNRVLGHLNKAAGEIVAALEQQPDRRVDTLSILTDAEWRQLQSWNETQAASAYAGEPCIHKLFEAQAAKTPEAIAVVFNDQQITYRELNQRSNRLAHYLIDHGIGPEVKVGLCLERSIEMIVGILGIIKAGGAYVPLDPEYPMQRLHYLIDDSGVVLVLTSTALGPRLLDNMDKPIAQFCLDQAPTLLEHYSDDNPGIAVAQDSLIYVIYTSGSTGTPKGVLVTHAGYTNHMQWMQHRFPITAEDKVLHKTPLSFDAAGWEWSLPLMHSATLVVARAGGHRDPDYLLNLIEEQQISVFQGVPSLVKLLLENAHSHKLQSLKYLFCGGEALSENLCQTFKDKTLPATLCNLYGPTEATIDTTYWTFDRDKPLHNVPIGRPIDNAHVYILDTHRHAVPVGVVGELYIGGVGLARGYLNRDDLSAEKFVKNPLAKDSNAVLYRSGDLARYLPDGNIEYVGRIDHQVKIRGFRIELSEIESVIKAQASIDDATVLARQRGVASDHYLVAYLIGKQDIPLDKNALREALKEQLPDYMVPNVLMTLDKLPLTSNGKLDRKALPAPDEHDLITQSYSPPTTEAARNLASIWANILNLAEDAIGIHDNFFDLGGHSLLVIRLISMIEREFGKKLATSTLFSCPTIKDLEAELADDNALPSSKPWTPLVAIQPAGKYPPLFCVHPAGGTVLCFQALATALAPKGQPVYGLEARGLIEGQTPYSSIEEMAQSYIEAIKAVQPKGPYNLLGYSSGGNVAFEMAQQLIKENENAAFLGLLDTALESRISQLDLYQEVAAIITNDPSLKLPNTLFDNCKNKPEQLAQYIMDNYCHKLSCNSDYLRRWIKVTEADITFGMSYKPKSLGGKLDYFRAKEKLPLFAEEKFSFNWKSYADEFSHYDIPGNHVTLVSSPNVEVLAESIWRCLKETLNKSK